MRTRVVERSGGVRPRIRWGFSASMTSGRASAARATAASVVPGGASTSKAINADVLEALGPKGVFINIGRGSTVDEDALAEALRNGTIFAAGLDVFADEPNVPKALLDLPNASLLPHVGSASIYTRNAMADLVVDNLVSWFSRGEPVTAVPETAAIFLPVGPMPGSELLVLPSSCTP